jgi:branched-chain amino acid aminotransferase
MNSIPKKSSYVWLGNGIIDSEKAHISAVSPSARYGLSVFEGLRGYLSANKKSLNIFRLDDHLKRLSRSAEKLSIPLGLTLTEIYNAIKQTIIANEISNDCYIRVDLLSANGGSWHSLEPGVLTVTVDPSITPLNLESRLVSAEISTWRRIHESQMPPSVKAGANYINSRYGYLEVKQAGFDVPIFLNLEGSISESSGACIMAVTNGQLLTPPLTAQILNSITRETLLDLSKHLGIKAITRDIFPEELSHVDELFLCGTAVEIAPIGMLSGNTIGDGTPGEITRLLFENYLKEVRTNDGNFKGQNSSTFILNEIIIEKLRKES